MTRQLEAGLGWAWGSWVTERDSGLVCWSLIGQGLGGAWVLAVLGMLRASILVGASTWGDYVSVGLGEEWHVAAVGTLESIICIIEMSFAPGNNAALGNVASCLHLG